MDPEKTFEYLVNYLLQNLSFYFITFIASLSVVVFMFGIVKYIWKGDSEDARKSGRTLMLWGIIGLFVMFGVWGIVEILTNTFFPGTSGIPQFDAPNTSGGSSESPNLFSLEGKSDSYVEGFETGQSWTRERIDQVKEFFNR